MAASSAAPAVDSVSSADPASRNFDRRFHTGWGVSCDSWTLRGLWSEKESSCHIHILEMRAVEIMLMQKGSELARGVVRLLSENTSVVFYLNKQGGTRS